MPRESFQEDLRKLKDQVLVLGGMVESALEESVKMLKNQDVDGAERLIAYDERINAKRFEIEDKTLTLIATQQPMAGDMRTLAGVLEIATELERMGDYAKGIAKICVMIGQEPLVKPLVDIPMMAEKTRQMLHQSLDAFVREDLELARSVPAEDDEVDDLYNQVYRELITLIMSNPTNLDQATYLLWAAHNLERTADRVINICERVVFTATGHMREFE